MTDVTDGTEDSKLELMTMLNGGQTTSLTVEGNGIFVPNGGTIGGASDTDLLTLTSGQIEIDGKIRKLTIKEALQMF